MNVHVFIGPTLRAEQVPAELGAVVHGPAAFGDVYRAARSHPSAIAIIDGYFEHVPAVWHKEVLWALAEGIAVFGASSMGALRAAELEAFGMIGVGEVFDAFRSGRLEDDDEVAVAHGAPESGFAPVSEAMVNIRFTLADAEASGVISAELHAELVALAKHRFYAERGYPTLLHDAQCARLDPVALRALAAWLPNGKRDQKQADALRLLRELPRRLAARASHAPLPFHFEPTDAWHAALSTLSDEVATTGPSGDTHAALLEELKLAGSYRSTRGAAAARARAVDRAVHAGVALDRSLLQGAMEDLRKRFGLRERRDLEAWRAEQRLEGDEWPRFVREEARVHWARPETEAAARTALVNELRASGAYGRLIERVEGKRRRLSELGVEPGLAELGLAEPELWHWYFATLRGLPAPADLASHAYALGFDSVDDFRAAVLREYCYQRETRVALGHPSD